MGADGHIVIAGRADFEAANPGVNPGDFGLYTGTVLGIDAVWGYYGDNLCGSNYGPDSWTGEWSQWELDRWGPEKAAKVQAAYEWFEANAETHEVWT